MLAVASRELVERRNVFIAAAVAAVLPFFAPLFPWLRGNDVDEVREVVALTLATAFAAALALGYGAATISGELKERRFGFYFSRPLSGLAIWAGKLLAGVVLVWVAPLVVLLPTWLAARASGPWQSAADAASLGMLAAAAVLLLALAHAVGIALRARSPWLVVDVVMLVVVALLIRSTALRLIGEGAFDALRWTLTGVLAAAAVAVVAAGAVQVACGRTHLRRGHRVLSLTLWGSLLVTALAGQAFSWWVVHPSLADIVGVGRVEPARRGSWVAFEATPRGRGDYAPAFLVDIDTGASIPLGGGFRFAMPVTFSADGRQVAWLDRTEMSDRSGASTLVTVDLASTPPTPQHSAITFPSWVSRLVLSDDGRRVAALHEGTLSVSEVASGALVAAVRLPGPPNRGGALHFLGHDAVRCYRFVPGASDPKLGAIEISDFDVVTRATTSVGRIEPAWIYDVVFLRTDLRRERLLCRTRAPGVASLSLRAAASGALLADLDAPGGGWAATATFLADGRVAVTEAREGRTRLRVLAPDGAPEWSLDLGDGHRARPAGESAPGSLLVVISADETWSPSSARTVVVDLPARTVETLPAGLVPLGWMPLLFSGGDSGPAPGSVATRAFLTGEHGLAVRDPATGAIRPLVAGGRPSAE
jgi:hypothetical protein